MRKQVYAITIGVLLVLSVFSVLQFWQIKPAQATSFSTFGHTTLYSDWENWPGEYLIGERLTTPIDVGGSNFTVTVRMDGWGATHDAITGLHSDNAGSPDALLATSDTVSVTSTEQWYNFSVTYSLVSSTAYWFSIHGGIGAAGFRVRYNSSDTSATGKWNITATMPNNPDPWPSNPTAVTNPHSYYITYEILPPTPAPEHEQTYISKMQVNQTTVISSLWGLNYTGTTLSTGTFSWNGTGAHINETTQSLSGTSAWLNTTKTMPSTLADTYEIIEYVNDSDNTWTTKTLYFTSFNSTMQLHNDNGVFKNENGTIVYLRGVGHIHGWIDDAAGGWIAKGGLISDSYGNIVNSSAITENLQVAKAAGADHIRKQIVASYWENDTVTEDGNVTSVRDEIKRWLNLSQTENMYCILSLYDIDYVTNTSGIVNWWGNVSQELKYYPNLLIEIRNEPDPTGGEIAIWQQCMQDVIDRVRAQGCTAPVILMHSLATLRPADFGYRASMEWGLPAYSNFSDPINDNICYSGHLYRTYFVAYRADFWNQTLCYADMVDMAFLSLQQATHRPVIVGEIGVNMWEDNIDVNGDSGMTNQTEELTWAENVLKWCNSYDIGYSVWDWMSDGGDQWYLTDDTSFTLSRWGIIFAQCANADLTFPPSYSVNTWWSGWW